MTEFHGKPASHPDVVKGKAGSPYAIRNFFDVAPYLAKDPKTRIQEFQDTVARLQGAGLKIIIDFVPNHTAREYVPFGEGPSARNPAADDDTALEFSTKNFYFYLNGDFKSPEQNEGVKPYRESPAKATGNDCFKPVPHIHDWYETAKINYGFHPETGQESYDPMPKSWPFMLSVLNFWIEQGVDGFRCDMVDMVPVPFWRWALAEVRKDCPDCLFIGESYDPDSYEALLDSGFNYLYDKVGLYDASLNWLEGKKPSGAIGTALWNNRPFEGRLLRFSENHDEVRLASLNGSFGKSFQDSESAIRASIKALALAALCGDGPLMVYMGQELAEPAEENEGFSGPDGKTTIFDYWSVPSLRRLKNGGVWNEATLLPDERETLAHYRRLIALKNDLGPGTKLYNLQPANPKGYGEISFEDGFFFLIYSDFHIQLVAVNRKNERCFWEVIIPFDFFRSSKKAFSPGRMQTRFPQNGAVGISIAAAEDGGLLLKGKMDGRYPLVIDL